METQAFLDAGAPGAGAAWAEGGPWSWSPTEGGSLLQVQARPPPDGTPGFQQGPSPSTQPWTGKEARRASGPSLRGRRSGGEVGCGPQGL